VTIYQTLSLVGTAKLAPAESSVTLSREEMEFEFEKFGTSLTFEHGESWNDVRFSSASVKLGANAAMAFHPPSTLVFSYSLPREVTLGSAKLSGDLTLKLEMKFVPKPREPGSRVTPDGKGYKLPEPSFMQQIKVINPAIYLEICLGLALLQTLE